MSGPTFLLMFSSSLEANTYSLTGPTTGLPLQASSFFTVSLPTGSELDPPVTVTPTDFGAGGTFSESQLHLSTNYPQAIFTYTPPAGGTYTIGTTNDSGLFDPANISYIAQSSPYIYPCIVFQVSLLNTQYMNSYSQPDNNISNIINQISNTAIQIPGVGNLRDGDKFFLTGPQATYVKNVYADGLGWLQIVSIS